MTGGSPSGVCCVIVRLDRMIHWCVWVLDCPSKSGNDNWVIVRLDRMIHWCVWALDCPNKSGNDGCI